MKKLIIAAALIGLSTQSFAATTMIKKCVADAKQDVIVLDKDDTDNSGERQFWVFNAADLDAGKLAPLHQSLVMYPSCGAGAAECYTYTSGDKWSDSHRKIQTIDEGRYIVENGQDISYIEDCDQAPSRYQIIIAANGKADPKAIADADQADALTKQAREAAKDGDKNSGLADAVKAAQENPARVASRGMLQGTHNYTCDLEYWGMPDNEPVKFKTAPNGVKMTTIAVGTFGRIEATFIPKGEAKARTFQYTHSARAEYGDLTFAKMPNSIELLHGNMDAFYEITNCKTVK